MVRLQENFSTNAKEVGDIGGGHEASRVENPEMGVIWPCSGWGTLVAWGSQKPQSGGTATEAP